MRCRLSLFVAFCLATSLIAAEEENPAEKIVPTRILRGTEYREAVDARNSADRLREDLQKRMPPFPRKRPGEKTPAVEAEEFAEEIAEVIKAYQNTIDRFAHTEIAAFCAMRLAGFYQYQGKYDTGAGILEKTAKEFAGTREGARVAIDTGLVHLQTRKDHVKAMQWFARVPKPDVLAEDDEDSMLYLSAQIQLIRCELALDRDEETEKRLAALKEEFPKFADQIDREYKFMAKSRDGMPRKAKEDK